MRWQVAAGVVAILALRGGVAWAAWTFPAGGVTEHHAVVAASTGRPLRHPEPTYVWHGIRVPVGACGAMVHGKRWVLACTDPRAVAYRRRRAQRERAVRRDEWAAGVVALGGLGAACGVAVWCRSRLRRAVVDGSRMHRA